MNQFTKELLHSIILASLDAALNELKAHRDDPCIKQHSCLLSLLSILKPALPVIKSQFPKEAPLIDWAEKEIESPDDIP